MTHRTVYNKKRTLPHGNMHACYHTQNCRALLLQKAKKNQNCKATLPKTSLVQCHTKSQYDEEKAALTRDQEYTKKAAWMNTRPALLTPTKILQRKRANPTVSLHHSLPIRKSVPASPAAAQAAHVQLSIC
jgi:hypothetical protein